MNVPLVVTWNLTSEIASPYHCEQRVKGYESASEVHWREHTLSLSLSQIASISLLLLLLLRSLAFVART